ncbi:MAG: hypothetical protein U0271_18195 [Polyangiaceae bacterium]
MPLKPADVRAFLDRPWGMLEAATQEHRAEQAQSDPEWAWQTAQALREEVRRSNPSWPTAEDRARDLEHHVKLKALIDRASHELRRRRPR